MAVSILFIVRSTEETVRHKTELIIVGHLSTLCLLDVTTCDQIFQVFPLRILTKLHAAYTLHKIYRVDST